jgi:homoserine dehydrogenase
VLVRHPEFRAKGHGLSFTGRLEEALAGKPDLLVEVIGGTDYPAEIMCGALNKGVHVVTANKAALAKYYDMLHASADAGKASLAYSGAVGGGAPILETVYRLRSEGAAVAIEGVMNGTANFLLHQLGEGKTVRRGGGKGPGARLRGSGPGSGRRGA